MLWILTQVTKLRHCYQLCIIMRIFYWSYFILIKIKIVIKLIKIPGHLNLIFICPNYHITQHDKYIYMIIALTKTKESENVCGIELTELTVLTTSLQNLCTLPVSLFKKLKTSLSTTSNNSTNSDFSSALYGLATMRFWMTNTLQLAKKLQNVMSVVGSNIQYILYFWQKSRLVRCT